jgi:hypothetical protein
MFYISSDGRMMSVRLSGATSFDPGVPRPLFPLRDILVVSPYPSAYDVQRDGQRFLVRVSTEELQTRPLNVLVHWTVPVHTAK